MTEKFDEQLEIFHGSATAAQARVYARLPKQDFPSGTKLTGTISGPSCLYAETLSATMRFVDRGPGDTILAEAIIPDPCFWTPQLPFLYRVKLQLQVGNETIAETERDFGVRHLGVKGKHLFLGGKRWVWRGGWTHFPEKIDLKKCHEAGVCLGTPNYDAAVFSEAARVGVMIVTHIVPESFRKQPVRYTMLSRFASVGTAYDIADRMSTLRDNADCFTGNVLKAQYICKERDPAPSPGFDLVIAEMDNPQRFAERFANCPVPVIVNQISVEEVPVSAIRNRCDALQAKMAPFGDFAGFIV